MIKLVQTRDGMFVDEYVLEQGKLRIGRLPENDICLDDLIVSGRHAVIIVEPSRYLEGTNDITIEDLGSTNGTTVNGRPIKRHLLKHREVVRIGEDEFTLIDEDSNASERTVVYLPEN